MTGSGLLSRRQVVMGVLAWVLIFAAFVTLTGIGDFVDTLQTISSSQLAVILATVSTGVVAMGSCLYVISRNIGLGFGWIETIFLNTSVSLAHNLTPFGQASGVPVGAAILSQRSKGQYEECLAALSVKDVVSFVPAILVFVGGGAYIVLFEQAIPNQLRPLFGAFALFVAVVVGSVLAVRAYPGFMLTVLQRLVGWLNRTAARLPLVPSLDPAEVNDRVTNFADSIGDIASDRVTVTVASALATTSFVAQGCLLWITLTAVGVDIPVALAIFIVPVSLLASGLPLPGGSGGVEGVQILMILTTAGGARDATITAVVLSRGLVFWTPIVLGSVTLLVLQLQGTFD
jgi:uncharacterized protein (TIRG00374 family)